MIRKRLKTNNRPQQINITIEAKKPCSLRMVVSDALHGNSIYQRINKGDHDLPFVGLKTFTVKLPLAPKFLLLSINCKQGNDAINIQKIEVAPLHEDVGLKNLSPYLVNFIRWVAPFVKEAGYVYGNRTYNSPDKKFSIKYLNQITDAQTGQAIDTPARINRKTGQIELNAKVFREYSIPMRMYMLLHEISHFYLNTRNEFEADDLGSTLYEQLGFPRIEVIYAFTKVFNDENPEQKARKNRILDKMRNYKNQEDAKKG